MKKIFTLLVTALVLGTGSVMAEVVTTISDKASWKSFVASVANGDDYSSTTVKLTNDLEIESETNFANTYMAGTSTHPFNGTFDGQGYKITYTKTGLSDNVHGLFRYINGATIKNLKVAGTLESSGQQMGGIVGQAHGNITIANCESSVTLTRTGSSTDDATYGGIVGIVGNNSTSWTMNIKNCIYTGTITVNKSGSGLVGYIRTNVTMNISYCLFAGTISYTSDENIANFSRGGSPSLTDCYYVNKYNSQGTEVTTALKNSGKLAYTLNTENTESVFIGQGNLNKSNIENLPSLTSDAAKKVYKLTPYGVYTPTYVNSEGALPNPVRYGALGWNKNGSGDNLTSLWTLTSDSSNELYKVYDKYVLNVSAAGATTLVLPFDADLPSGVTAYNISYTSGNKVTATSVSKITANQPVLINAAEGKYTFNVSNSSEISYGTEKYTNGVLTGVYVQSNKTGDHEAVSYVPANSYVLQNGASGLGFYKVTDDNKIKITSFRAYATFTYSGSAREFLGIDFNGNTTDINEMKTQEIGNAPVYNLNGQRVGSDYKGVVIQNGKKFVVK